MPRVLYISLFILAVFLTTHTSAKLTILTPESLFNTTFRTAQIYFQGNIVLGMPVYVAIANQTSRL